ncbi:hypothetical protein E2C01_053970 [Portunus trituberculatus]|uniref:Uncharacterized protein n=1 Tax=Portunus trituberculatus TaxID=210409 RepID=A0A5B7GS99_PORTR|nr:hypothetical protein [Portunus trituberculatus]
MAFLCSSVRYYFYRLSNARVESTASPLLPPLHWYTVGLCASLESVFAPSCNLDYFNTRVSGYLKKKIRVKLTNTI